MKLNCSLNPIGSSRSFEMQYALINKENRCHGNPCIPTDRFKAPALGQVTGHLQPVQFCSISVRNNLKHYSVCIVSMLRTEAEWSAR